ncbi:hypothetical protein GIY62_34815 (plasmid) [Burkholderia plantarii]|uniref:hypothetical protein n=1 Tax=Burkholderia plantarii TaxID=41899 RepID=UPI00272B91CC|nr:hypothetical protein [Burkholderia plantarii]WLE64199.1 hypothetical protein GIY62_34815 [Burkholderia plantarii]
MTLVAQASVVNWWVVGASSAVIAAVVNGLFKLWGDYAARRNDQTKLAEERAHEKAKLAEARSHALLDVALMLETFAKHAAGHFDQCWSWIDDWYRNFQRAQGGDADPWIPLAINLALVSDWKAVPVAIVSRCRELPMTIEESGRWLHASANEDGSDVVDAYELDGQRGVLYGLAAAELAIEIRAMINVPPSALATDCFDRLRREYDVLKQRYLAAHGRFDMIPDLRARLQREVPSFAPDEPE